VVSAQSSSELGIRISSGLSLGVDGGSLNTGTGTTTKATKTTINVGELKVGDKIQVSNLSVKQAMANLGHSCQERLKLLSHRSGTSTSSTKNVLYFGGNTVSQIGQGKVLRSIKNIENFSDFFAKLLGDPALLANKFGSGFVLGDKLGGSLFVDNARLNAVNLLCFVNCRKNNRGGKMG
jgi:hypothetical protein